MSASSQSMSSERSERDRGLGRGDRRAQVVADGGEQRGPHPVGGGDRLGRLRLGREPLLLERDGGVGGERAEHPPVVGRQRPPGQRERERVGDGDVHVGVVGPGHRRVAGAGDDGPLARRAPARPAGRVQPLEQAGRAHAERLPGPLEQRVEGALAAQDGSGRGPQQLGLGVGAGRLIGLPGRGVDDPAGDQADRDEHAERQRVVGLGNRPVVDRRGEVVVEQQRRDDGGDHRGQEPAGQRDRDHRHQEREGVAGEVDPGPVAGERERASGASATARTYPAICRRVVIPPRYRGAAATGCPPASG